MMFTRLLSIKVFYCSVIYFLSQVALYDCEVTLVTRNVTDSFHIGQDGCLKNASVCTTTASCQNDGSCLCNKNKPHFRNPMIILSSFGNSYGCITIEDVKFSNTLFVQAHCDFEPFQVIPNDDKQPATKFDRKPHKVFDSCTFENLEAKYPNSNTRIQINWLNETFMQLMMSGNTLSFQWMKSVSKLQGLIIRMNLRCVKGPKHTNQCLQAKVLGTWRSPATTTVATHSISVSPNIGSFSSSTNSNHTTTIYPSSTNAKKSSNDDGGAAIITVAVVVPLFLIAVILLVICLVKRRKRNRNKKSKRSTSPENNGRVNMAMETSHENNNSQSTSQTTEYATPSKPHIERVVVNGDTYAVSTNKGEKKQNEKDTAAAPNVSSDSEYAKPDIDGIVVNGNTYAVVNQNKTTKPKQELNYMKPENLRLNDPNADVRQPPSQPTEYAPIVGVMEKME